jgi:hypothetical protein
MLVSKRRPELQLQAPCYSLQAVEKSADNHGRLSALFQHKLANLFGNFHFPLRGIEHANHIVLKG